MPVKLTFSRCQNLTNTVLDSEVFSEEVGTGLDHGRHSQREGRLVEFGHLARADLETAKNTVWLRSNLLKDIEHIECEQGDIQW